MAEPRAHDIYFRSATEIDAALENQVSKGGWFIVCDEPDPRGQAVLLRFHLPGLAAPFEVLGEVAFAAPKSAPVPGLGSGMAIQFQKLSPQVLKAFSAAATIARSEISQPRPAAPAPAPEKAPPPSPAQPTPAPAATAPAAPPAAKPAGAPIGKLKLNLGGPAKTDAAAAAPPAEPAAGSPGPESEEWSEEPDENWPEGPAGEKSGADPAAAADEDSLEDTGPEDAEAEPDESQQRKILTRINAMNPENLYGALRQMPFHQKVVAAKRGGRSVRAILIQEGNQKIMNFLLQNPQISVPEIMLILKTPSISYEVITSIAKNAAWSQSEEVRFLIVTHPKTSLPLALNILPNLNVNSLAKLAKSGASKPQVKSTALKLLEQRRKSS